MTATNIQPALTEHGPLVRRLGIRFDYIRELDNQGEDCPVCDTEGATVDFQGYVVKLGDNGRTFVAGCMSCLPAVLSDADPSRTPQIEVPLP
jgi:hypothetical protein